MDHTKTPPPAKKESQIIETRNLRIEDYHSLKASMIVAYAHWEDSYWKEHHIAKLLSIFPDGQFCVLVNGQVVGAALSLRVKSENLKSRHTYPEITGNYTFDTHVPEGDILYGIDVFIHPDFRGLRLGRRMYDLRKELCENLNLRSIVFGGRIPNYKNYADKLSPKEYIEKVKMREIHDPTLNFQLSNDFHVRNVLTGYLPGDVESLDYAVLLEWNNIYYEEKPVLVNARRSVVRIGLIQWQMRMFSGMDKLVEQVEYFVDAVSDYHSDFILFPEFFNAPLMAEFNHLDPPGAIRGLASYTEPLRDKLSELAVSYYVNIITGSMPLLRDGKLYNVGYLCRRDGSVEMYEKIHITPGEVSAWGMVGGNRVRVFETDCGKVGIVICYDVEFPELGRILADQGMTILFVPFLTDTQNGYTRVRRCAQARAIENECYVAISGCVGNLPNVNNMDIAFSQSAVFTPSDFSFPTNGIKAEATPNTEMITIADVDLNLLRELNEYGSVRNMKDRRTDLYSVKLKD